MWTIIRKARVFLLVTQCVAQQCSSRATKYDSCKDADAKKCGWRYHEPATPGKYELMRTWDSVESMRAGWTCFMGGTGYPDPAAVYTQPGYSERFGRGYFYKTGKPSIDHIVPLDDAGGITTPLPWLADPTAGYNKYDYGCEYISDLLVPREDGKSGFTMKAMRPSSLEAYTAFNKPGFTDANEVYTLRLESDDLINGGLIGISVDWLPYGAGAWPAFWMVGTDPVDWVMDPPRRPGMGLRNYWPLRGEIDIIEYVNAYTQEMVDEQWRNHVTLHEPVGCHSNRSTPSGRGKLAADPPEAGGSDCAYGNAFTGCSVSMGPNTVGHPGFMGGYYICDWIKDSHVDCWFFNKKAEGTYSSTWTWPETNKNFDYFDNTVMPSPHYSKNVEFKLRFKNGSEKKVQDGDNNLLESYWRGLITLNIPGRGRVATFLQDGSDHTLFTAHYGVTFDYGQFMSVDWQGRQPSWFLSSASQAYEDSMQFNLHWSPINSWNDASEEVPINAQPIDFNVLFNIEHKYELEIDFNVPPTASTVTVTASPPPAPPQKVDWVLLMQNGAESSIAGETMTVQLQKFDSSGNEYHETVATFYQEGNPTTYRAIYGKTTTNGSGSRFKPLPSGAHKFIFKKADTAFSPLYDLNGNFYMSYEFEHYVTKFADATTMSFAHDPRVGKPMSVEWILNFKAGTEANIDGGSLNVWMPGLMSGDAGTGNKATFKPDADDPTTYRAQFGSVGSWNGYATVYSAETPIPQGKYQFAFHLGHPEWGYDPYAGAFSSTYTIDANYAMAYKFQYDIEFHAPKASVHRPSVLKPVEEPAYPPPPAPIPPDQRSPPPPTPHPQYDAKYTKNPHTLPPIDLDNAQTIDVKDLGPPDVRHDLSKTCHSDDVPTPLADMRLILNTVVCGQWSGAIPTTAMPNDNDGFSYPGGSASNCEREFKKYLDGKHKQHGNQDHLPRRWDWDVNWIKVWT